MTTDPTVCEAIAHNHTPPTKVSMWEINPLATLPRSALAGLARTGFEPVTHLNGGFPDSNRAFITAFLCRGVRSLRVTHQLVSNNGPVATGQVTGETFVN